MSRQRTPSATAFYDQLAAAYDSTLDMHIADSTQLELTGRMPLSAGPAGRIAAEFRRRDEEGSLQWCRHLRPESPRPAIWLAWRPGRLYCGPCMAQLPPLSSKEDRRCDACRSVQPKIHPCRAMIPARLLPERAGKPEETRPPAVIMYGLCGRCKARSVTEGKLAAAAVPVRFRMPAFGRPLTADETAGLSAAVAVARHFTRGEPEEMLAAVTAPGVDSYRVTWGLLILVRYALEGVLQLAEYDPQAGPPSFEEVLTQITGTGARWRDNPLIKFPGEMAAGTREAAGIILRIRAGDQEALSAIVPDWRAVTLGGLCLIAAVAELAVMAGLAGEQEQVWSVMLEEIASWSPGLWEQ
jgi:hypothetical protein